MSHDFRNPLLALAAILLAVALPLHGDNHSNARIVRVTFLQGDVRYHREGKDSGPAALNLAIEPGFGMETGDGFAEVEFEDNVVLRLAKKSSVLFTKLALTDGRRETQVSVFRGTAIITANLARGDELSVAVSNLNLTVPRSGRFRVDVTSTEIWVTALGGKVDFTSPSGTTLLMTGQMLHEQGTDTKSLQVVRSPAKDTFDKWDSQRASGLIAAQSLPTGASTPARTPANASQIWPTSDGGHN